MEVKDFPNYLIYDDGRVWGNKTKGRKEGFMKCSLNECGYLRVGLTNQKGQSKKFVARLVAQHYVPNPDNYPEVDHFDRNPINNHYTNLRWADRFIQNQNKGKYKSNTSGHPCIYKKKNWFFRKKRKGKFRIDKSFNSKIDCICYKYIILLRIKANHYK